MAQLKMTVMNVSKVNVQVNTAKRHRKIQKDLIDNAMTTSVGTNKEDFCSVKKAEDPSRMISDGGELDSDCTTEINGVG